MLGPPGECLGGRLRAGGREDDELVAADPRDGVAVPKRTPQPIRDDDQQLVAEQVAEAVVDVLELIDVDEQQAHSVAGQGPAPGGGQPGEQQLAVGQAGQGVVQRPVVVQVGQRLEQPRHRDALPTLPSARRTRTSS